MAGFSGKRWLLGFVFGFEISVILDEVVERSWIVEPSNLFLYIADIICDLLGD